MWQMAAAEQVESGCRDEVAARKIYELESELLVSPLITPIVVPCIIPYIFPFKVFRLWLL